MTMLLLILIHTSKSKDYCKKALIILLGDSPDGVALLHALSSYLPLTTLINLNDDPSLAQPMESIFNPTAKCDISYLDFLCHALARDVPSYLSSHSSSYSHQTLSSIIDWNSSHPEYIPYGQTLFLRALQSPITQESYEKYKQLVKDSFQSLVDYLRSTYSLDCLLTIGKDDLFSSTTVCGIPRANLTLDYYNPDRQQMTVVAVGFSLRDDFLLLRLLHRLEKANLQAGKIDTRTTFQKYVQRPLRYAYRTTSSCSIL